MCLRPTPPPARVGPPCVAEKIAARYGRAVPRPLKADPTVPTAALAAASRKRFEPPLEIIPGDLRSARTRRTTGKVARVRRYPASLIAFASSQLRGNEYRRGSLLVGGERCNSDEVSRLQACELKRNACIRLGSKGNVRRIGIGIREFGQEFLHLLLIHIRVFWCSPFVYHSTLVDLEGCGWCHLPTEYSGLDGDRVSFYR